MIRDGHWRMIHTVFRELTPKNKPVPCPTLGAHWVRIGFQGGMTRTDINRAMRCLLYCPAPAWKREASGALPPRAAVQGGTYRGKHSRGDYASMAWRWTHKVIRWRRERPMESERQRQDDSSAQARTGPSRALN